jgi:hypothetical protein
MPAPKAFAPDVALFRATFKAMVERLKGARVQEELFLALRWGMEEMDKTYASTPRKILSTVACRAGCDFCCHVPMGVQAHEVFYAADFIRRKFPADTIPSVIAKLADHRKRVSGISSEDYSRLDLPCALLQDHACSIYEARPEVCRAHHAKNARACESKMLSSQFVIENAYVFPLRVRMFGVMLGIDQAFAEAGFDGRAYDFGSALHEALTDSLRAFLWVQKQPAFSDTCREPAMSEDIGRGEFRQGAFRRILD